MAEQKTITIINGVDTDVLKELAQSVQKDPSLAKSNLRIDNKWTKCGYSVSTVSDFYGGGQVNPHEEVFQLVADEPPILAGTDKGASPMEYLLHALAGCLTSTLAYHAALHGIQIHEMQSHLEGDLDIRGFMGLSEDVRKGFENIRVTIKVKTDEKNMDKLRELASFSAVLDVVSHATPVDIQLERK